MSERSPGSQAAGPRSPHCQMSENYIRWIPIDEIIISSVMMSSCVKCKRKDVHVVVVVVDNESGNIVFVKEEGV